jgi:hypothetical protein
MWKLEKIATMEKLGVSRDRREEPCSWDEAGREDSMIEWLQRHYTLSFYFKVSVSKKKTSQSSGRVIAQSAYIAHSPLVEFTSL